MVSGSIIQHPKAMAVEDRVVHSEQSADDPSKSQQWTASNGHRTPDQRVDPTISGRPIPITIDHGSSSPSKSRTSSPNRRSTVQRLNPNHPGHHERIMDSRQEWAVSHEPAASSHVAPTNNHLDPAMVHPQQAAFISDAANQIWQPDHHPSIRRWRLPHQTVSSIHEKSQPETQTHSRQIFLTFNGSVAASKSM
ncbi:hypothetical protein ACLOJK_007503 [Asimina triloba]